MPQDTARPLSSFRLGAYDEPPASAETSTPQTRRSRLRRAIQDTRDLARSDNPNQTQPSPRPAVVSFPMPTSASSRRNIYVAPSTRRRQRSSSAHRENEHEPHIPASNNNHDDEEEEEHGTGSRRKRRRLDPTSPSPSSPSSHSPPNKIQTIKYGYYGQVEPGRLKLDLISCDGGEHRDPRHPGTSLAAENVLRHDKSVYCSERAEANLVLRHMDEGTPFCLEKLWVVGPEHGFTAPVREGLVYVAMTLNELQRYIDPPPHARLSRFNADTAARNRHNRHRSRERDRVRNMARSIRSTPERLTLAEALRDPEVNNAASTDDHRSRGYMRHDWGGGANADAEGEGEGEALDFSSSAIENDPPDENEDENEQDYYTRGAFPSNLDHEEAETETEAEAHCDIPFPYSHLSRSNGSAATTNSGSAYTRPVTLLSDEEPGPEDSSTQDVLDYRLRRLRLARRRYESEHWDREERWAGLSRLPGDASFSSGRVGRGVDAAAAAAGTAGGIAGGGGGGLGMNRLDRLDALMARSRVNDSASASASPGPAPERERGRGWDEGRTVSPPPPPPPPAGRRISALPHALGNSNNYITAAATAVAAGEAQSTRGPTPPWERGTPTQTHPYGGRGADDDANVTQARFYIKRHRNKVAIRFDPPVSGRFVLLKLWADPGRGNVDVQSVIAMGFGGGRFFPAIAVR